MPVHEVAEHTLRTCHRKVEVEWRKFSFYISFTPLTAPDVVQKQVVTSVVTGYLEDHAAPAPGLGHLAGASCDGAPVMMGPENGVMARLRRKVPDLVVTHCSAHRLALAASDTARRFSWFKRFERLVSQVYTFFSCSAKRFERLVSQVYTFFSRSAKRFERLVSQVYTFSRSAVHTAQLSEIQRAMNHPTHCTSNSQLTLGGCP